MLTLLTATKIERPTVDYERIYLDGMVRGIKAKQLAPDDKTVTKRIIFYTVKYLSIINIEGMSRESLEGILVFDQMLLNTICELTPAELLTIFPVTKSYDGERYECKDYFSTMEALQAHGLHEPIRSPETASDLLWDYMNTTVMMYRVHCMSVVSELHSMETGKGLMEQFFEDQGVKLNTFRKYENDNGQTFMIGEDGRSFPVVKKTPRYLRPLQ
ncbi:MAG: hypothetical protein BI182_15485 [Acetobacterium sp. MES1]|uniref:hypothetical protein n=1 Tax=Acetobacterium sp. MES1 TaxID=1899015 RepID=UPI000B9CCD7F|nr:hypothetical protein [Acetobacterium sp. MES1]OXS25355.1 MAG: hypothetical protein BI182_15485 [Acetobacterium sp. MES1]